MDYYISENKALILAAGLGTRLAPLTNDKPKSLVQVNGKPILIKQIESLYYNGVTDITIVSGYKADFLEKEVHLKYPNIKIIESKDYEITNNMYSAYLGMKSMFSDGNVKPFFMMNADVFFDASVITALEQDDRGNLIVVDVGNYNEESMKVRESEGRIVAISKQILQENALGCSIDVYKFNSDGGKAFFKSCIKYIEGEKNLTKWSEVALNDILGEVIFYPCKLNGRWFEIDTIEDLKAAENLFED